MEFVFAGESKDLGRDLPDVVQVAVGDGFVRGIAGRDRGGKLGQLIEDLIGRVFRQFGGLPLEHSS